MKFTAFILSILMMLSLAACSATDENARNNKKQEQNIAGETTRDNNRDEYNRGLFKDDDSNDTKSEKERGVRENETIIGSDELEKRTVYYNGNVYRLTDEFINDGDVGIELFSIRDMISEQSNEDGMAVGIDKGTKVFRIKDDNNYDSIAVEINNRYHKAVKEL